MSRRGDCWDNAVVERPKPEAILPEGAWLGSRRCWCRVKKSFFASLRCELDFDDPIGSRADTRAMIFEWIEVWYKRE